MENRKSTSMRSLPISLQIYRILMFIVFFSSFITSAPVFCQQSLEYGVATRINTMLFGNQTDPTVYRFNSGNVLLKWWSEGNGTPGSQYYFTSFDANGSQTFPPFAFPESPIAYGSDSWVATLGDNSFVVFAGQLQSVFSSNYLYYQIYDDHGKAITELKKIDFDKPVNPGNVSLERLSDHSFVLAWLSESKNEIQVFIYKRANNLEIKTIIRPAMLNIKQLLDIVSLADEFIVIWRELSSDSQSSHIYAQRFNNSGEALDNKVNIYTFSRGINLSEKSFFCGSTLVIVARAKKASVEPTKIIFWERNGEIRVYEDFPSTTVKELAVVKLDSLSFLVGSLLEYIRGEKYSASLVKFDISAKVEKTEWPITMRRPYEVSYFHILKLLGKFVIYYNFYNNIFFQNVTLDLQKDNLPYKLSAPVFKDMKTISLDVGGWLAVWSRYTDHIDHADIYAKRMPQEELYHKLSPFHLIHPAHDATMNTSRIYFRWQRTTNEILSYPYEIEYRIYVDDDPDFSSPRWGYLFYNDTLFVFDNFESGRTYFWKVMAKNIAGDSLWSSNTNAFFVSHTATYVEKTRQMLHDFLMVSNYPNPFNPSTSITYELPRDGFVVLKIYDIAGRLVRVLVQEQKTAGAYTIEWNGLDAAGRRVAAGVYLYRLEFTAAGGERMVLTKKMSLVK